VTPLGTGTARIDLVLSDLRRQNSHTITITHSV